MSYQGVRVERELPNDISAPRRPVTLKSSSKRASRDSQDLYVRFRTSRPHDLFNTEKDGLETYLKLGDYRNFVAEEWTHALIWDLFVGRFIWLDGRRRGIFTSHSTLLTNFIGPPGLLLHLATCVVVGKGLPSESAEPQQQSESERAIRGAKQRSLLLTLMR